MGDRANSWGSLGCFHNLVEMGTNDTIQARTNTVCALKIARVVAANAKALLFKYGAASALRILFDTIVNNLLHMLASIFVHIKHQIYNQPSLWLPQQQPESLVNTLSKKG